MRKIVVIYDNIMKPNQKIQTIIGNKSYADIILKRKNLYNRYEEVMDRVNYIQEIIRIDSLDEIECLKQKIQNINNVNIVHIFSNYLFTNEESFEMTLNKACYINENVLVQSLKGVVMIMYQDKRDYIHFLEHYDLQKESIAERQWQIMDNEYFINLEDYNDFLDYISGGFDARFFNQMTNDEYTVVKKSTDKQKIKKEYMYYKLLPEESKKWMVLPYNYKEEENQASYTMERMFMPDLAIRWTHNAITIKEFRMILEKLFYYISTRPKKEITKQEYKEIEKQLYISKLEERIEKLKEHPKYEMISSYINKGTKYKDIDDIVEKYRALYKSMASDELEYVSVIGHGDLCFSNILYNEQTNIIRFIDPKGALEEKDLWANPYYDIAKLSHSICGLYDFFNCGLYDITLTEDLMFELEIKYNNQEYKKIFKEYVEKLGYDYRKIRLYEASLFLSMLPLHMDYPKKVFGFLLNGISILEKLEEK